MIKYRETLWLHAPGVSQRGIACSCSSSRNTISDLLKRAQNHWVFLPFEKNWSDAELPEFLYPEKEGDYSFRRKPDCEYIHKELAKSGVTLSLLWEEYCLSCKSNQEVPYKARQFCRFYHAYASKTKATMRIKRKPGELMEETMHIKDNITGEDIPAYVFVSALPCSQYAYVEDFLSMKVSGTPPKYLSDKPISGFHIQKCFHVTELPVRQGRNFYFLK